ncbi:LOB domain-containing protein 40 [Cardamine amara subsp. amara]|uniref:LOB domain-containing protein 40 n=1 Tax=Cardamine amara subsp. amara TaxID=228776 RepID=A0ABD1APX4_CARAN
MRMSCNGCRVLRKGCSENCSIRPCLQWIKSAESQANATVFLAKLYGRAGLMNLLNAGPDHLRPAIFRSLLYEACGRIVNPIYGSVGLLWSGNWHLCQAAVEAVMRGSPVTPIACDAAVTGQAPPFNNKLCDIRHVSSKDENVKRSRCACKEERKGRSLSHESSLSHQSLASSAETTTEEPGWIGLELTLGLEPVSRESHVVVPMKKRKLELERCGTSDDEDTCKMELGLVCSE